MILLEADINGKVIQFDLPDSHDELTFGQITKIAELEAKDGSYLREIVNILSGIDAKEWEGCTDLEKYIIIEAHCVRVVSDWTKAINAAEISYRPTSVKIGDVSINFPEEILNETVGQYQDCIATWSAFSKGNEQWEKNAEGTPLPPMIEVLKLHGNLFKIYADTLLHDHYSYGRAMALDISGAKWKDVFGWGNFFLGRVVQLSRGTQNNVPGSASHRKNLRRELSSWAKIGDLFSRLTHWLEAIWKRKIIS
jgi:hypothetical protein